MKVKTDRGGTGRAMPELVGGEALDRGLDVFADLLQCVRGRLEVGLNARERAAEPDFGDGVHWWKVARDHVGVVGVRLTFSPAAPSRSSSSPAPSPRNAFRSTD